MKFDIKARHTNTLIGSFEIEAPAETSEPRKLGLAVIAARKVGANLSGANLSGANLSGANLSGADLSGADLYGANLYGADSEKVGTIEKVIGRVARDDGYLFIGVILEGTKGLHIAAGCRNFSLADYRNHVNKTYPGTSKAAETLAILDFLEARYNAHN